MEKPHIEKEYKMMIDEDIYKSFLNYYKVTPIKQVNYYYSTFSKEHAMRIREKENKYIFTLKVKGDGFRYEYEFEVPDNSLNHDSVKEVLDKFNITQYEYLGLMSTDRALVKFKYGELCIDKSEYLGFTDYEIEFELYDYTVDRFEEFEDIIKRFNLVFKPSEKSKYGRFIARKK